MRLAWAERRPNPRRDVGGWAPRAARRLRSPRLFAASSLSCRDMEPLCGRQDLAEEVHRSPRARGPGLAGNWRPRRPGWHAGSGHRRGVAGTRPAAGVCRVFQRHGRGPVPRASFAGQAESFLTYSPPMFSKAFAHANSALLRPGDPLPAARARGSSRRRRPSWCRKWSPRKCRASSSFPPTRLAAAGSGY